MNELPIPNRPPPAVACGGGGVSILKRQRRNRWNYNYIHNMYRSFVNFLQSTQMKPLITAGKAGIFIDGEPFDYSRKEHIKMMMCHDQGWLDAMKEALKIAKDNYANIDTQRELQKRIKATK